MEFYRFEANGEGIGKEEPLRDEEMMMEWG
jgi:hypothetical protein